MPQENIPIRRGWYHFNRFGTTFSDLIYVSSDGKVFRPTSNGKKEVSIHPSTIIRDYFPENISRYINHLKHISDRNTLQREWSHYITNKDIRKKKNQLPIKIKRTAEALEKTIEDLEKTYPENPKTSEKRVYGDGKFPYHTCCCYPVCQEPDYVS